MDRPLGPRQPDKRTAAYESIFGRPGVSHHSSGPSTPQNYQPPGYSPGQYPYPSNQQLYSPSSSHDLHNSPYSSHAYLPQPSNNNRQSYYAPTPPQDQSWSYPNYSYVQPQYPHTQPANNPLAQPIYPDDPPDPGLESLYHQSLPPTHTYPAQPYPNVITHQQPEWGPHSPPHPQQQQPQPQAQQPAYEYDQGIHYQNGSPSHSHPNIPHLGLNIDVDNGRLGIDFAEESSPSDTDDSELPWAHSPPCSYLSFFEHRLTPNCLPSCSQQTPSWLPLSDTPANSRPPPFRSAALSSRFPIHPLQ